MPKSLPPIILLMGPTATGKSKIGVELAQVLGCEIISVDSAMVYRGMDIGTAKPNGKDRLGIPHHLIDILDPAERFSTGQFCDQAISLMREITARDKIPLLVGGTMLYFNALLNGLAKLPAADSVVRGQIEEQARSFGWDYMHEQLSAIDPKAADRIHPHDPQRIQRALEVFRITGETLTELCEKQRSNSLPYSTIKLIIEPQDRSLLHKRIESRFLQMIRNGLIFEVQKLHKRGDLHLRLPSVRAVGYRQIWEYLDGKYDKDTMVKRAVAATRQLAKRQLTWLNRDRTSSRFAFEQTNISRNILNHLERLFQ